MMKILLDTDILTIVQRANSLAFANFRSRMWLAHQETAATTIISFEEQMRGWLAHVASATADEQLEFAYRELQRMLRSYEAFEILDFDMPAIIEFRRLRKSGLRIGTMDLRIASVALAHDAVLISRNLVDFQKVPGLRVEDWTQPAP